jgi:ribosomal protein S18 acetylase RimI-like enzyme
MPAEQHDRKVVPFGAAAGEGGEGAAGRRGSAERDMARFGVALMPPFRAAQPGDAPVLAHLINLAGEGLPMHFWRKLAAEDPAFEGCTPFEVGVARARRRDGGFSYRRAVVIHPPKPVPGDQSDLAYGGASIAASSPADAVGMLLGARQAAPYETGAPDALPAPVRPLVALEAEAERIAAEVGAPGTWYLNALAVLPPFQGRGLGGRLMAQADVLAKASGARFLSLIMRGDNDHAAALYRRCGYRKVTSRPISPWPNGPTGDWVLMLKEL